MSPLRGLLLGHGHMGAIHARKLAAREDVALVVVDPPQGRPWPGGGPRTDFDFALIAAPTAQHAALALPLLAAGVPCLIEKPLAADLQQAEALAAHAHALVGHVERFNPALAVVDGLRPRFIEAERLAPFPDRSTDVDVIADVMVHDLDLVTHFLPGAVEDVRAVGVGVLTGRADIVHARLEVAGPTGLGVAVLTASRVSREPVRKLRLVEDGGYWSIDLLRRSALRVRWGEGELDAEPVAVPPGDSIEREHDALLAFVRDGTPFPVTARAAAEVLALAARVRAATARHEPKG